MFLLHGNVGADVQNTLPTSGLAWKLQRFQHPRKRLTFSKCFHPNALLLENSKWKTIPFPEGLMEMRYEWPHIDVFIVEIWNRVT